MEYLPENLKRMETIEEAKYEGYIWMSDSQEPLVITPDKTYGLVLRDTDNPFVVEGNLWNADTQTSIMVKYIDGKYIVRQVLVTEEDRREAVKKEYIPHRIEGAEKLSFLQYWVEEADPLCEGMTTLRPGKLVFVGFSKHKEDEK